MAYKEMLKLVLVMAIEMDKLACTNMQLELQGSQPSCISGRNRWIVSKGKKKKKNFPQTSQHGQLKACTKRPWNSQMQLYSGWIKPNCINIQW